MALMNQYALVAARFPPMPVPASTASTATNTTDSEIPSTSQSSGAQVKSEEASSSAYSSSTDGPSTSQKTNSIETYEIDGNTVTIEDIGRNDPSDSEPMTEVRRRRLQKFETKTPDT